MNTQTAISTKLAYVTDSQLAERYGVGRATIWRWSGSGHMPRPVKLSPGCTRWQLSDLEAWEAEKRGVAR